jgi:hypothetical protein
MVMDDYDFSYGCESGYGRYGGEEAARNFRAPSEMEPEDDGGGEGETEEEKKEILGKYEELMKIWAQIVEVGVSWDPTVLAQLRQQLQALMCDLKIIDENGKCDLDKLIELCGVVVSFKENAGIKKGYPDRESFDKVFSRVKRDHVLINDLRGRDGEELGDYLYGLGIIMDNEVVYKTIFENDPITFRDGEVENGRHREAAKAVLAKCEYSLLHEWLKPEIEK